MRIKEIEINNFKAIFTKESISPGYFKSSNQWMIDGRSQKESIFIGVTLFIEN